MLEGARPAKIYVEATITADEAGTIPEPNGKRARLSMHGVIGPMKNGDALGSCGQISDTILDAERRHEIKHAEGWDRSKVFELLAIWDAWHLNDMRAGCEHQRAERWDNERIDPAEVPNSHANRDERGILAMWVTQEEHPKGLLSKPCGTCGYEYGSAWLHEELPRDIINRLERFPVSTSIPAWI